ncbi:guanylate kinase [Paenibacillus sp. 7124]|uniref:Guanylate kinase n=1 Tax=Paenibacillus apii TaxID=1850370 RepID=A0A6M1PNE7_9BACL|nr:guanylate kinase [Paenibacillus apii]NGM84726.1 guanylate kinase [Paenibacillus apii]NJJ41341.1 guanylate kinase [Paenibacillus apii]
MGRIIVLYGPSASGKSEIQRQLTGPGFPRIITATTRPPRTHEISGVHYLFLDKESFREKMSRGELIEWTEYNGEWYGTLRSSIEEAIAGPDDANIILDLAGVLALKERYKEHVAAIYIGADLPSLARRLAERGGDTAETASRLQKAREQELTEAYMQPADAVIWNSDGADFGDTLKRVREAIASFDGRGTQ